MALFILNKLNNKVKFINKLFNNNYFFVLILFLFGTCMYLNLLRYYIPITDNIVPWGDPFTYEMGYYELLNRIDRGENYSVISYIFGTDWYWLQKLLLFFFSPLLINEPYSICIINFFIYSVASTLFYFLLLELKFNKHLCRLLSVIFWIYPINYSFTEYSALPIMGLDSTFLGSLYCLTFSYLTFLKRPNSTKYQISFSIFLCAALIGRGNSIAIITLILFFPTFFFLYKTFKQKNYFVLKNFIIPSIFFIVTVLIFYSLQLKHILSYYSVFSGFLDNDITYVLPYLKHIPGIFFIYPDPTVINLMSESDYRLILISLICHLVNIFSFYYQNKIKNDYIKKIILTGLFIFYGTFIINLFLWMHPHINIYNAQLIWAPMRIGFTLIVAMVVISMLNLYKKKILNIFLIFLTFIIFLISDSSYKKNKEIVFKNKIDSTPKNIEKIQKLFKNNSQDGKVIILWYGPYINPKILNYYALKRKLEPIKYFRGKYADDIWNQSSSNKTLEAKVKSEIEEIFDKANLIVLNENSKNYVGGYAFYRYREFITKQIEKKRLNDFKIIAKIKSSRGNLLVFKRQIKGNNNFNYSLDKNNNYQIIY